MKRNPQLRMVNAAEVPVNDLCGLMANRLDLARGDPFHWKPTGSFLQGKAVAASIAIQLKTTPESNDCENPHDVFSVPVRPRCGGGYPTAAAGHPAPSGQ